MTARFENRGKTYDTALVLGYEAVYATSGLTGKTAAGATGLYVDLGGEGYTEGKVVFDVDFGSQKMVAGLNWRLELQGGKTSAFTSHAPLAMIEVGDSAGNHHTFGLTEDKGTGRYIVPFANQYGDELYRYLRMYLYMGGSITTGLTCSSFITK